jgi:ABC-type uncharacterized transport system permease subunit
MLFSFLPVVLCLLAYCLGVFFLWQNSRDANTNKYAIWVILAAVIVHGLILYRSMVGDGDIAVNLGTGISVAGWVSVVIYLLVSSRYSLISTGLVIIPIAVTAVLAGALLPGQPISLNTLPSEVIWHVVLAVPAYGFLCLAFAQACLLIVLDKQLRNPSSRKLLTTLPAIQTMEYSLFMFTLLGFAFMTINLLMGMATSMINQGSLLAFNHHIILSLIAWIAFGCLLIGRRYAGWRGEIAAKWTIGAFSVLFLAYFGTRFVNDIILGN